jgi:hypothetical protein
VVDNNDNLIMKFGRYGNVDSWGGLPGYGMTVAVPAFPLAYPVSAAASEDYIYVGDMVNWRMMRVQMDYALDNLPGLTDHGAGLVAYLPRPGDGPGLYSSPNPFGLNVVITYTLPGKTSAVYRIYDTRGRVVFSRDLSSGVRGTIRWNGRNPRGVSLAAGFYAGKLIASDGKMLTHRLLLLK